MSGWCRCWWCYLWLLGQGGCVGFLHCKVALFPFVINKKFTGRKYPILTTISPSSFSIHWRFLPETCITMIFANGEFSNPFIFLYFFIQFYCNGEPFLPHIYLFIYSFISVWIHGFLCIIQWVVIHYHHYVFSHSPSHRVGPREPFSVLWDVFIWVLSETRYSGPSNTLLILESAISWRGPESC